MMNTPDRAMVTRAVVASAIGTAIEWYERARLANPTTRSIERMFEFPAAIV